MSAFVVSPMVIIEDESDAGGTIRATVVYQRGDTHDRTSVASIIDTVIMRNGFLFCSIDHCDEPLEVAGGWPLLE